MQPVFDSSRHDTKEYTDVTDVDAVAVYNEEAEEVTIFAVNRDLEEGIPMECDIRSFPGYQILEHIVLESDDLKASNGPGKERVVPGHSANSRVEDGILKTVLNRASWNVIRLKK